MSRSASGADVQHEAVPARERESARSVLQASITGDEPWLSASLSELSFDRESRSVWDVATSMMIGSAFGHTVRPAVGGAAPGGDSVAARGVDLLLRFVREPAAETLKQALTGIEASGASADAARSRLGDAVRRLPTSVWIEFHGRIDPPPELLALLDHDPRGVVDVQARLRRRLDQALRRQSVGADAARPQPGSRPAFGVANA